MTAIWNLGSIGNLTGTMRMAAESAPGAGGWLEMANLVFKGASGKWEATGTDPVIRITQLVSNANLYGLELGAGGLIDGSFKSILTTGEIRIGAGRNIGWGGHLTFVTDTTEKMRINAAGRVGIGTQTPSQKLHISDPEVPRLALERVGVLNWYVGGSGGAGDNNFLIQLNGTAPSFVANTAGNNGVGTTTPAARWHVKSTLAEVMRLETATARGSGSNYLQFFDPTGSKGFMGYGGSDDTFFILNSMTSLMRLETSGNIELRTSGLISCRATSTSFEPGGDNSRTLGTGPLRWSTVFAATGTINTSDEREKKWRGPLTDAEFRAGEKIIDELGFYQWLEAIEGKSGSARYHFGARAQRVWSIFAEEGLVDQLTKKGPGKTPYAFLCYDKWDAEKPAPKSRKKGSIPDNAPRYKAGDRYGLRVDQLALFLVAVQARQISEAKAERAALADRLDAIEKALKASD